MRRVAAISAGPRSARPRGRRALSLFCLSFDTGSVPAEWRLVSHRPQGGKRTERQGAAPRGAERSVAAGKTPQRHAAVILVRIFTDDSGTRIFDSAAPRHYHRSDDFDSGSIHQPHGSSWPRLHYATHRRVTTGTQLRIKSSFTECSHLRHQAHSGTASGLRPEARAAHRPGSRPPKARRRIIAKPWETFMHLTRRGSFAAAIALGATILAVPALAEDGVTADTITFGQAAVLEGPASALGLGMQTRPQRGVRRDQRQGRRAWPQAQADQRE